MTHAETPVMPTAVIRFVDMLTLLPVNEWYCTQSRIACIARTARIESTDLH